MPGVRPPPREGQRQIGQRVGKGSLLPLQLQHRGGVEAQAQALGAQNGKDRGGIGGAEHRAPEGSSPATENAAPGRRTGRSGPAVSSTPRVESRIEGRADPAGGLPIGSEAP